MHCHHIYVGSIYIRLYDYEYHFCLHTPWHSDEFDVKHSHDNTLYMYFSGIHLRKLQVNS